MFSIGKVRLIFSWIFLLPLHFFISNGTEAIKLKLVRTRHNFWVFDGRNMTVLALHNFSEFIIFDDFLNSTFLWNYTKSWYYRNIGWEIIMWWYDLFFCAHFAIAFYAMGFEKVCKFIQQIVNVYCVFW